MRMRHRQWRPKGSHHEAVWFKGAQSIRLRLRDEERQYNLFFADKDHAQGAWDYFKAAAEGPCAVKATVAHVNANIPQIHEEETNHENDEWDRTHDT